MANTPDHEDRRISRQESVCQRLYIGRLNNSIGNDTLRNLQHPIICQASADMSGTTMLLAALPPSDSAQLCPCAGIIVGGGLFYQIIWKQYRLPYKDVPGERVQASMTEKWTLIYIVRPLELEPNHGVDGRRHQVGTLLRARLAATLTPRLSAQSRARRRSQELDRDLRSLSV